MAPMAEGLGRKFLLLIQQCWAGVLENIPRIVNLETTKAKKVWF